jgi:hypothetical protein
VSEAGEEHLLEAGGGGRWGVVSRTEVTHGIDRDWITH